jgi:hypothetical protein
MSGSTSAPTIIQFTPPPTGLFSFQVALQGPTSNATSTDTSFTLTVFLSFYGLRLYFMIEDQSNNVVLTKPLIASPPGFDINLVAGYFATSVVFLEADQQFVVTQPNG